MIATHPTENVAGITKTTRRPAAYFFVVMSLLFLAISIAGFVPSYQAMHNGTRRFPIHWLAHVHGILMTTWLLLFTTQSILAAKGRLQYHRKLGMLSVGIGILIGISMLAVSARVLIEFDPPVDHFLYDVLIIQLYALALYAVFFPWAIIERKNAPLHKRFILLSTIVLMQAGIDRLGWLPGLLMALPVRFFYLDLLLILLLVYDWRTIKRIHKVTWIGLFTYIFAQIAVVQLWGSPGWHTFWFNVVKLRR